MPSSRILVLTSQPSMLRGRTIAPATPAWPVADPVDTADYLADFAPILDGREIVQLDYAAVPSGSVVIAASSWSGSVVTLRLKSGVPPLATVVMTLTLADGEQLTRSVVLPIVSQGARPALSPNAITTNGLPILTAGQPLLTSLPPLPCWRTARSWPPTANPCSRQEPPDMPEAATGYPATAQLLPTDVLVAGCAPAAGSPAGTPPLYFGNPLSSYDAAIRPIVEVGATGTSLVTAAALGAPGSINVVTVAVPGGGVRLQPGVGTTRVLARAGQPVLVYPSTSTGAIETRAAGSAVPIVDGAAADFHTMDGNQFYAG